MELAHGPMNGRKLTLSSASLEQHKAMTDLAADQRAAIMLVLAGAREQIGQILAGRADVTAPEYDALAPLDPRD
jgi:hypothetical protein